MSLIASGSIFSIFGVIKMKYSWLKLKGKYYVLLGLLLLVVGIDFLRGAERAIVIGLLIIEILAVIQSIKCLKKGVD